MSISHISWAEVGRTSTKMRLIALLVSKQVSKTSIYIAHQRRKQPLMRF